MLVVKFFIGIMTQMIVQETQEINVWNRMMMLLDFHLIHH